MASYKVIFLGLSVVGPEEESRLLSGLQKRFNLTPGKAEGLLQKVPVVVKKGLSKLEAERFVKAFDEIGGRVKVEEEEEIPLLDITQGYEPPRPEPKPDLKPESKPTPFSPGPERRTYNVGMVTCPQCGFEQPQTDECVKCGIIISKYVQFQEMARSVEGQVREISAEEFAPWEGGGGFVGAFLKTTQEVLFSPTKFFRKTAAGKGYWSPFIFALITGIIGSGVALLWQWLLLSGVLPRQLLSLFTYGAFLTIAVISIPFTIALSIVIGSGIIHLCLMIVRGNRNGFEATFRAISYTYGAELFYIVPFIGTFVGTIYMVVLAILGVREGHGISTGKAALAVLLPVIVAFVGILLAVLIPLFMVLSGSHPGVRV
ncbi:MAG TPA: YIP1 family protein [Thermodesulfobacteriota bacterium]|nr:YIP1 family protein [Thermodesulfobacteriota bacterium]